MTHTFKKVALFAAVVSVAAVGADKKAILAVLDKVVALDTLVGAGTNVVVAGLNGYVNHTSFVSGAKLGVKAKSVAQDQFIPKFSVDGKETLTCILDEAAPKDLRVTTADLLAKGLGVNAKGVFVGKATETAGTAAIAAVKAGVDLSFNVAGTSKTVAIGVDVVGDLTEEEVIVLTKLGAAVVGGKLVAKATPASKDYVKGVEAAIGKVVFTDYEYSVKSAKSIGKGALNLGSSIFFAVSFANTVRHLMAKKAAQVEETEVVDAEQVVEDVA